MQYTNKLTFWVNSRDRLAGTGYSDSYFKYQIFLPQHKKFDKVCVSDIVVPKSYYMVSAGNNTFTLTELGQNATVTIAPANYKLSVFQAVLTTALNNASASLGHNWTYTVTFPNSSTTAQTGLFTYTVANNTGQPSFTFGKYEYLNEQLGFPEQTTQTFVANTLTSTVVVKFQGEDTLFLHSDICSNGLDDVLSHIFVAGASDFSNIRYLSPDPMFDSKDLTTRTTNVYTFSLTDENGQLINLNGQHFMFKLDIYCKDNVFDLIRKYIGYLLEQVLSTS